MMLETAASQNDTVCCLKLSGELDISTVEIFRMGVENIPEVTTDVQLDFSDVEFVDSTGIGSLVQVMNQLHGQDIKVRIIRIPKEIYEVFDLLGIPELMGEELFECLN